MHSVCVLIFIWCDLLQAGVTVREYPLPSDYPLPQKGNEFVKAYDSLLVATISDLEKPRMHLKDNCVDKSQRKVFAGGRLFSLDVVPIEPGEIDWHGYRKYVVRTATDTVYTGLEVVGPSTVWAFFSHGNSWILETRTRVVVDGQDISDIEGCEKAFHYRVLDGVPVFLMRQDGHINIKFGSDILEPKYDVVLHHLCCEGGRFNAGCTADKVMFYAYRDEQLLYVEVIANPHN
jgi:hypothetical protein